MSAWDLIVVGAGIVGAACAEAAARAGLRVAIIEPGPIGGAATAASMGHLVALDGNPAELALACYSLQLWDGLVDAAQIEFNRCGTLWVARNAKECALIPLRIRQLAAAGVHAEQVDAQALYRLEPELAPRLAGGMHVPSDAVVYPPAAARELVRRAQHHGAQLFAGSRVDGLLEGGVQLDSGERLDGPVLVATGTALQQLLPELPLCGRKGHLLITERYPGLLHHQILEIGYTASAHGTSGSSVAFNAQPRPSGHVLLGSSREFDVTDSAVSPDILQRMLERALEFVPALGGLRALRTWTGQRPTTPDGLPYLGAVPGRSNTWVAAGHEGLGVTTALGSAAVMLDLIRGRAPAIDPRPYAPSRMAS